MAKIRNISEFVSFDFPYLIPNVAIPFDIYLYFPKNENMVHWKKKDDFLTGEFLSTTGSKGIQKLWIHKSDQALFDKYLTSSKTQTTLAESEKPNELAQRINNILFAKNIGEAEKARLVSKLSQTVLNKVLETRTQEDSQKAQMEARKTVQEIITPPVAPPKTSEIVTEIFELTASHPQIEHAANVATLSVIFAMGFGRIETSLLLDLALAGLIHDIGLTQVPTQLAAKSPRELTQAQWTQYYHHSEETVSLLNMIAPYISDRVKMIVAEHHEKFNGTGFPRRIKGFQFDDIAQLLSMADFIDTIASGCWDDQPKPLVDAIGYLENMEKSRNHPEHFNPELFSVILRWIRSKEAADTLQSADQLVVEKATEITRASENS